MIINTGITVTDGSDNTAIDPPLPLPPELVASFEAWVREVNARSPITTVIDPTAQPDQGYLAFHFDGYPAAISGILNSFDLNIAVHHGDDCWDLLFSVECVSQEAATGFVCSLCEPEDREAFATLTALWREHWFAPLEEWLRDVLAPADRLALHAIDRAETEAATKSPNDFGARWATLFTPETPIDPDHLVVVLSLPARSPMENELRNKEDTQ